MSLLKNNWKKYAFVLCMLLLLNVAFAQITINKLEVTKSPRPTIIVTFNEPAIVSNYNLEATDGEDYNLVTEQVQESITYSFDLEMPDVYLLDGNYFFNIQAKDLLDNQEEFIVNFSLQAPETRISMIEPENGVTASLTPSFIFYTDNPTKDCRFSLSKTNYNEMPENSFDYQDEHYYIHDAISFPSNVNTLRVNVACKDYRDELVSETFYVIHAEDIEFIEDPTAYPGTIVSEIDKKTNARWQLDQNAFCRCSDNSSTSYDDMAELPITPFLGAVVIPEQRISMAPLYFGYKEYFKSCNEFSNIMFEYVTTESTMTYYFSDSVNFITKFSLNQPIDNVVLLEGSGIANIYEKTQGNNIYVYAIIENDVIMPGIYSSGDYEADETIYKYAFELVTNNQDYNTDKVNFIDFLNSGVSVFSTISDSDGDFGQVLIEEGENIIDNYELDFFAIEDDKAYNYYIQCTDMSLSKKTSKEILTYNSDFGAANYINVVHPEEYIRANSNLINILFYTPEESSCTYYLTYPNDYTSDEKEAIESYYIGGNAGYYYSGSELLYEGSIFPEGEYNLHIDCQNDESQGVQSLDYEFYVDRTAPSNVNIKAYPDTCQKYNSDLWTLFRFNGSVYSFTLNATDSSGVDYFNLSIRDGNKIIEDNIIIDASNNRASQSLNLESNLSISKQYQLYVSAVDYTGLSSSLQRHNFKTHKWSDQVCAEHNAPKVKVLVTQLGNAARITLVCNDDTECDNVFYAAFALGQAKCSQVKQTDAYLYKGSFNISVNSTICYMGVDIFGNIAEGNETVRILKTEIDSDGDGLPDWWEQQYFDCKNCANKGDDPDHDCLNNLKEYQLKTNPTDPDSDADGYYDGEETWMNTDPLDSDSHGTTHIDGDTDGLPDWWECMYFACRTCADPDDDSDNDGIDNADEYDYGTDPTKKDTDGDGYDDLEEIKAGTDPLDPDDHPEFHDADNDGLPDWWEQKYFGCLTCADPNADPDGDGLSNHEEFLRGTDPTKKDTDGDGWNDGIEIKVETDPNDAEDHPTSIWVYIGYGLLLIILLLLLIFGALYAYNKYYKKKPKESPKVKVTIPRKPRVQFGLSPAQLSRLRQKQGYKPGAIPGVLPEKGARPRYAGVIRPGVKKREQDIFDKLESKTKISRSDVFYELDKLTKKQRQDVFDLLARMLGEDIDFADIDNEAFAKLLRLLKKEFGLSDQDVFIELLKLIARYRRKK